MQLIKSIAPATINMVTTDTLSEISGIIATVINELIVIIKHSEIIIFFK